MIYNIQLVDAEQSLVQGITRLQLDTQFRLIERIDAALGVWKGNNIWELSHGYIRKFLKKGTIITTPFESRLFNLNESIDEFQQLEKDPEAMNLKELRGYIQRLKNCGYSYDKYLVDFHTKIAITLTSLIMVIISIPFGIRFKKGSIAVSLGVCLLIAFCYWIILAVAIPLGKGHRINPFLAAWLANFLFSTIGFYFFTTVKT